jgi:VanZ family protein
MALIGRFGPPVGLMAVIFALSAQPDLNSGFGAVDLVGRKLVHMSEFGLLWFLWARALHHERPIAAALIAVGYAATDEVHQSFVEGRNANAVDVAIDAAGVALAWALWQARAKRAARGEA